MYSLCTEKQKAALGQAAFSCSAYGLKPIALLETVHAPAGIDELLLPGIEGMALRADFNFKFALDRASLKGFAASAPDYTFTILGMDIFLHRLSPLPQLLTKRRYLFRSLKINAPYYNARRTFRQAPRPFRRIRFPLRPVFPPFAADSPPGYPRRW